VYNRLAIKAELEQLRINMQSKIDAAEEFVDGLIIDNNILNTSLNKFKASHKKQSKKIFAWGVN